MTCIKKRLRIAYENIAFYGNKTWINDCVHYTRMNQELYARECKIQESEWTELVVRRPRTVQDVIPNSKLAQYLNSCEYNASRELSYRPTLSFDITFHYPCLYRNSSYNEPWMLPEVEELFMMHTCVDTLNFMCYKKLEDLPNLDFIDARHSEDCCCQLEIEEDFHEISPLLEDMFDRTPGQPSIPGMTNENDRHAEVMIPPLYKVTTLDEMLMKMKLRFGNIRQIWSVSKGGTCPDRAMKVFKSPFKSSFVREKHQFDILGIEMFTLFPHGKDARRLRNLREIRSIQKLAEAIKDFQKSLKQIKHHQHSTINHNHINSQDTSAPSLASEEGATSSAPTTRRLYSDVVQGLSSIKTPPSIKSENYSTECTTTPSNSSARESYISISSCSSSPQSTNNNVVFPQNTRSQTPPIMNWIMPETGHSGPFLEELQSTSKPSQHSIASSSYRTLPSSTSASSDVSSVSNNNYSISVQRSNNRIVETSFQNVPQCAFSNVRPVNNQLQPQQQMATNFSTTCFYSNSYAPCNPSPNINNTTVSFCPATGSFYHQQNALATYNNYNYGNLPQQQVCTFRNTQQVPPIQQQPNNQVQTTSHIATRTYSSQNQNQTPTSNTWIVTPHLQFTPQTTNRNNTLYSITNYASPYVFVPSGTVIKTNNATVTPRWPPGNPQIQNQQQCNRLPMSIAPTPPPQQNMQIHHQNAPQSLWAHMNQTQGTIYKATPSPQQITIEESRRKPQQCPPNPTAILIKPNILDQQQKKVSKQEENKKYFKSGIVVTSKSEDLERQALEEYHPSNETFLTEIERQAEEQYDSSSENWLSPPSSDFLIDILSRGAFVMSILIA